MEARPPVRRRSSLEAAGTRPGADDVHALRVGAEVAHGLVLREGGDGDRRPRTPRRPRLEEPLVRDVRAFEAVSQRRVVDGGGEGAPWCEHGPREVEEVEEVGARAPREDLLSQDPSRAGACPAEAPAGNDRLQAAGLSPLEPRGGR
jgi:hypothetical protein